MNKLTEKQEILLRFIAHNIKKQGRQPSYQEIVDHFKWGSKNAVASHLKSMQKKGYIVLPNGKSRAIVFDWEAWAN